MASQGFEKAGERERIVLDETLLLGFDAPKDLALRKRISDKLYDKIRPLSVGRHIPNFLLYGPAGSGKILVIRRLIDELRAYSSLKCVYVDCWRYYTRMAVYSLIAKEIGEALPRRGLATDEVFDRLVQLLERSNTRVVVFLVGIDGLIFNKQERLLYDLSNASRTKPLFSFVGICEDPRGFTEVDEHVVASLRLNEIPISPYNESELVQILTINAKEALAPGSFNDKILQACARETRKLNGNAKSGLELLWKAACLAESDKRKTISMDDILEVSSTHKHYPKPQKLVDLLSQQLSSEEQLIVSILANGAISSSVLYTEFQRKLTRTKRQIRNYLKRLYSRRIIDLVNKSDSELFFKPQTIRLL